VVRFLPFNFGDYPILAIPAISLVALLTNIFRSSLRHGLAFPVHRFFRFTVRCRQPFKITNFGNSGDFGNLFCSLLPVSLSRPSTPINTFIENKGPTPIRQSFRLSSRSPFSRFSGASMRFNLSPVWTFLLSGRQRVATDKAARRKFAALQTVIVSERL
jgi:hypothetical protein